MIEEADDRTRPTKKECTPASDPYRELFERSTDPILIIRDGRFIDFNPAALKMLRYASRDELLQTHPSDISPPLQPDGRDSIDTANEHLALASARGSHRFEWEHVRSNGEAFPVEVLLTAVPHDGAETLHVVWRDLSEQKKLEHQLRHAQKMDALGRLAGGIAHDFNNVLAVIVGCSELLETMVEKGGAPAGLAKEIHDAGERGTRLVRQLLTFSRADKVEPRQVELRTLLDNVKSMLERLVPSSIIMDLELPPSDVTVRCDPTQIEQIVVNLVTNARDAMPAGGTLRIALDVVEIDHSPTWAPLQLAQAKYARLTVADTGTGMDTETASRAFEPFFTTKGESEGTGLGLATVYGISLRWGGTVRLESAPASGTEVLVYLPLSSAPLPR